MSHDWIINALRDLRKFAAKNELPELAEQLDDAIFTAVAETTLKTHHIKLPTEDGTFQREPQP